MSTIRPASKSEAKPLIGFYAQSGNGKTWSSLLLARGFVGPAGKICMIETEGGRGEANVGREPVGNYLVRPLRTTFSPTEYGKAIAECEAEKVDALIIDSASAEWEGPGGVLSMAAANQANGSKGVLVWQQPKILHKRDFMLRLMQTPIPLVIVCMRAKYPMEQVDKPGGGKDWARSKDLEPIQADDILYEMFVHGWIDAEHRFRGTKYTLPELAGVIKDGEPISIESGKRLAAWAKGSGAFVPPKREEAPAETPTDDFDDADDGAYTSDLIKEETKRCEAAAAQGWDELKAVWEGMPAAMQDILRPRLNDESDKGWKNIAKAAKAKKTEAA